MSINYDLDYSGIDELHEKFKKLPENIEGVINSYIHQDGADVSGKHITKLIRISDPWKPKARHAKTSNWWTIDAENLGFTLKPKGGAANKPRSFGYLVFPNEGRGPRNPIEQRFMEGGLESGTPKIITGLNDIVDRKLKEVF